MNIIIYSKHLQIGNSLDEYIKRELKNTVTKYFRDALNAHVTIKKEGQVFKTEIIINDGTGTGVLIKSNREEYDSYKSFNMANERIEKQLRRYKTRIKNHRKEKLHSIEPVSGTKYVIPPLEKEDIESHEKLPVIIAEKPSVMEILTVKDAVMKMDLLNLPAFVFINDASEKLNVVYYRKDGNISWVDTKICVKR